MRHDWFMFRNMRCCRNCGLIYNVKLDAKTCRGIVKVTLRSETDDKLDSKENDDATGN